MAGHSKWANIKRHKAVVDAKKGKLYTKLIREITVAAQQGGGEPNANPRLRAALESANEANMTKEVIQRAIKRGTGEIEGENMEEIRYEGYGPGGIAVIVDCMTNNRNRTVAEVRHAFSKHGGNLGTEGSVAYQFTKSGQLTYAPGTDEEKLIEIALESGAEDVLSNEDGSLDVITSPEQFLTVKSALIAKDLKPEQAEITMRANVVVNINDNETAEKIINLIDALEELDDVQSVYFNGDREEKE